VSNFCLKTAFLVLASHKTVKKILNGDFTPLPPLAGDIYTLRGTSASHGLGHDPCGRRTTSRTSTPPQPQNLPSLQPSTHPQQKKQCLFFFYLSLSSYRPSL
jgi:hypothetical protein